MIKTTRDCVTALERTILELHEYDVPELLVTNVLDGYPPYLKWVSRQACEAKS